MASLEEFQTHRRRLWAVAYRLTGSVADADDAVQEAWLRWQRLPDDVADDPGSYLTTVVSRICLDLFTSARARRETYAGPWLPEPVVTDEPGPEEQAALDESVGMALLFVLERLTPAERTALVLHDVFSVPFQEIAEVVDRSPESVRQLASRARKRVRAEAPRQTVDRGEHRRTVEAFLAAVVGGELADLMEVLDPTVVWRSDGGGRITAARLPVVGREKVARYVANVVRTFAPDSMRMLLREVNGAPGAVFLTGDGEPLGALAFTVHEGRITDVAAVVNPDKLSHLQGM
ncbi:RNA polymerase sigma factor SigJ [Streptomyces sp. NPDC049555]|uniref:RNA polymerase sigma factor SigJ n=1 Tax=Streptomyces sp. NPDC049555 TaxID=3154930 RepID=UPI0034319A58